MEWNHVANISSICTMVLFLLYFLGRVLHVLLSKEVWEDDVTCYSLCDNNSLLIDSRYKVIESFDVSADLNDNPSFLVVTANTGIRCISFYKVDESDRILSTPDVLFNSFLRPGHSIVFKVTLPECQRCGQIQIITRNYKLWLLDIEDNLHNGLLDDSMTPRFTMRHFLYELLK